MLLNLSIPKPALLKQSLRRSDSTPSMELAQTSYVSQQDIMAAFMQEITNIRSYSSSFHTSITNLSRLHSLHLNSTSKSDQLTLTSDINSTRSHISHLSSEIRTRIIALNNANQAEKNWEMFKVKKIQIDSVKKRFGDVLQESYRLEKEARDKYKELAERQYKIVKTDATESELSAAVGGEGSIIFGQELLHSRNSGARSAYQHAEARAGELREIESSLRELVGMINDMTELVLEQDDQLKRVEEVAKDVDLELEKGNAQIMKAKASARRRRKLKWICAGVLFSLLLVLIVVIVVMLKK